MQNFLTIISIYTALALSTSSPAMASRDECDVPMSMWQSRSAAILWGESQGWELHRIKIDDGCYELYGLDEDGRQFEVKINPSNFDVIKFEYEAHGYRERIRPTDPPMDIMDIEIEN